MNAVGLDGDVRTLLHEGGHAFHALASRGEPLAAYRESPIEFCEVASMTMELLGARDLERVLRRGRRRPLVPPAARRDRPDPPLDRHGRRLPALDLHPPRPHPRRAPGRLERRCSTGSAGSSTGRATRRPGRTRWHRQLHIFLYPFYYIEYGIAQLGALQIWQRALTDRPGAVAAYRRALALGGSRPLPELFAAAGIPFNFSEAVLTPLTAVVHSELDKLAP